MFPIGGIGGSSNPLGMFGSFLGGGAGGGANPLGMIGSLFGGGGGGGGGMNPLGMIGSLFGGGLGGGGGANPLGMIGSLFGAGVGSAGGANPFTMLSSLFGGMGGVGGGQDAQNPLGMLGGLGGLLGDQGDAAGQAPAEAPQFGPLAANWGESSFEPAPVQRATAGAAPVETAGAEPVGAAAPRTTARGTNPYQAAFERAAEKVGVPKSWATSPAMMELVRRESSFRPEAKNPKSTAYGMFQFLKSTWRNHLPEVPYGTKDPYWQAVGGMRYIKERYGSPEKALEFHRRNNWY